MGLEGQASFALRASAPRASSQAGYAMAALLAMLAVTSVLMAAALPVWRHEIRREKEAELAFRGEQYVRAIYLFQRRYPGTYPPNLDILVEQKFLRKKYKDPITGEDFQPLRVGQIAQQGRPGQQGGAQQPGGTDPQGGAQPQQPRSPTDSRLPQGGAGPLGGIIGVASKSTSDSIRLYQGRTKYNQWPFVYAGAAGGPGGPGQGRPGSPGGRPAGPGAPGPGGPGPGGIRRPGPMPPPPPGSPFGTRPPG